MGSCEKTTESTEDLGKAIARVNTVKLLDSELEHLAPRGLSKSDSAAFVQSFINKWAYNEVFYQQALNYLTEEELDVTKELEAYKKELLCFKFQTRLIEEKLDTNISVNQIEEYYNANSQNFLLKNNIVKVLYVKSPLNIPNLAKLKKLCYSTNPKDAELLKSMCIQYANNYFMNDNTWLMFDDLKKEMRQLNEIPEYEIQNGKIFEFTDETSFYFLKIIEVKSKNTLSPLNFEKNNIKNMLINQRKQQLINTIKKDFFDKAKTNKELEIYN
ncbi:MAG: hypothetical protein K0R26_785 [Bacteroidota bacterium]|jgi:hypothetical protein|nr:hypothetical protein [Bacteroidota bacterium]